MQRIGRIRIAGLCLFLFFLQAIAWAQGPGIVPPSATTISTTQVIQFSGNLNSQPDGPVSIIFSLYATQQSTSPLWTETQTVQITGGAFAALLGANSTTGIPVDSFVADEAHWLGVQVNGAEQRYMLVSVPYAMKAIAADMLGGIPANQYVTATQLQTALQNLPPQPSTSFTGSNASQVVLVTQQGNGFAIQGTSSGPVAILGENNSSSGTGIQGVASSTSGQNIGVLGQSASAAGIAGVFDNTGGGQILSLRSNGTEVAGVDQTGNLHAFQVQAINFAGSGFGLTNIPNAATTAASTNLPNAIVSRDSAGNFSAGQISALNFAGNGFGLSNIPNSATTATPANSFNSIVSRDSSGNFNAGQISALNFVGNGFGLSNVPPSAIGATPANVANSVVQRDSFGGFSAGSISAGNFAGNGSLLTNIQNSATTATSDNAPNTIVARDPFGNFTTGGLNVLNQLTSAGPVDFSGVVGYTAPIRAISSNLTPASCVASRELLVKTDAFPGQQLFICNNTGNGYVLVGDGVANGVLSVSPGDSSVTVGGNPSAPTVSVTNGGITSAKLAPNAVVGSIADGSLSPAKIAGTAATLGNGNVFTANQTVSGTLSAINLVSGASVSGATGSFTGNTSGNQFSITQNGTGTGLAVTQGNASSFSPAISATASTNGDGIDARSAQGPAVFGFSTNQNGLQGQGVTGVFATGSAFGLQASASNAGTAGSFATVTGKILSGSGNNVETFSVDASGNLFTAGAVSAQYPNNTTFGTFVNELARLDANGNVERTFPADTSGIVGVVVSGAGFSGNARVAYSGIVNCLFDNATTVGHYVINSNNNPGFCLDAGSVYPSSGQPVGRVLKSGSANTALPILLFGPEQRAAVGSVTTINTGSGLTGGPISSTGTIAIAPAGVANNMLQNSSVTVTPGTGLSGGGTVALGGTVVLQNTGALSFNGRPGNVQPALGDYSFALLSGQAAPSQLPSNVAYLNQNSTFNALAATSVNASVLVGDGSGISNVNAKNIVGAFDMVNASAFVGDGSGITNVNAKNVGGILVHTAAGPNPPAGPCAPNAELVWYLNGAPDHLLWACNSSGDGFNVVNDPNFANLGLNSEFTNLQSSLTQETQNRQSGETSLQNNINSEASTRQSADTALQTNINTETAGRQSADAILQANINTETSGRQSDVSNLQTNINNVSAASAKLAASNTFTAGAQDFSGAGATLPVRTLTNAQTPSSCIASKELLIKTDAPAGRQLFICDSGGTTWNLVGDGASGGVASFNGRNGSVNPSSGDYSFSQISGSLAGSQMPAFSGDVTSAAGSTTTTLASTGVTAGTYTRVTVDAKGRVTAGVQAGFADLAGVASASQLPPAVVYNNQANMFTGNQTVNGTMNATAFSGSGAGLAGVNAASLNGLASSGFAQLATANAFTAKQTLPASSTSAASLNVPSGTAPSAPAAGDIWNTGTALQYRDNASTTRSLVSTTQSGGMQLLKFTSSITPASVAVNSCSEQSFAVSGINTGDVVLGVSQPSTSSPGTNIVIGGWRVSAANTVAIQFCNVGRNNSSTPVSGSYTFALMR